MLAAHGLTVDPETSEIRELAPYVGAFSARAAQIRRNVDRLRGRLASEHPGEEPGPRMREVWDRRAWAQARPDKVVPRDGRELVDRWNGELREVGYRDPAHAVPLRRTLPGWIDRDAAADLVVSMLGAKRSAWNTADIRGKTEVLLAQTALVADPAARIELAEDVTARAVARCTPLLTRRDVPEHVRSLTSPGVLAVEGDLIARLARRADAPPICNVPTALDPHQEEPDPDAPGRRADQHRAPRGRRGSRRSRQDHGAALGPTAAGVPRSATDRGDPDDEGRRRRRA